MDEDVRNINDVEEETPQSPSTALAPINAEDLN
jgi:hypothetical protein